jgi:hypothetical protein
MLADRLDAACPRVVDAVERDPPERLLGDEQPRAGGLHEHAQLGGRHPVVERDEDRA